MATTKTRFSNARTIPSITTKKTSPSTTNFIKGVNTYKPNDTMGYDELYLAQNARFERIGEYGTRHGLAAIGDPIGMSIASSSTAGVDESFISNEGLEFTFTPSADFTLYKLSLELKTEDTEEYCPIVVTIYDGEEIVTSSTIANKNILSTFGYCDAVFCDTPDLVSGKEYIVKVTAKKENTVSVNISSETPNYKIYSATKGSVNSLFEANIDGEKTLLFVFKDANGTSYLYRRNGNTNTLIRTLPAGVERVRFCQNINTIRYADGVEGPRIIDPSNSWSDAAIPTIDLKTDTDLGIKVSNIMDDTEDNIIYFDADTDTQAVWTYPYGFSYNNTPINSYDKFDRDFRQNFPAIKTGDPITAMFNLGGVVYILTRRNKYMKYSQTADVWTQSASNAQNGTFSQESVICDLNYAYYANDNGIYIFDGSSESSLTQNTIQNVYDNITNKESIRLELFNNRLYVFYCSNGTGVNDSCLVYNTNLRLWESFDTKTYVGCSVGRKSPTNRFICGHSHIGLLMSYEDQSNEYADLGSAIDFDIKTGYLHFGAPSQYKRIAKWRPEFGLVKDDYMVRCGYAFDFSDEVKYAFSVNLKDGNIYNEHSVWEEPYDYGVKPEPTKISTSTMVYGSFRRCQIRYQHHAAYEPVSFKSHTLSTQIQRIV